MPDKRNRFAELVGSERVIIVTEQGTEFDVSRWSVDEILELAFGLAVIDALPETPERV